MMGPNVMSSHHRNKYCGPCILVTARIQYIDGGGEWFLQLHFGSDIPSSSGIYCPRAV